MRRSSPILAPPPGRFRPLPERVPSPSALSFHPLTSTKSHENNEASRSVGSVGRIGVDGDFFTWPTAVPGLGRRRIGSFTPCADCSGRPRAALHATLQGKGREVVRVPYEAPIGTWARYGGVALCRPCARARAYTSTNTNGGATPTQSGPSARTSGGEAVSARPPHQELEQDPKRPTQPSAHDAPTPPTPRAFRLDPVFLQAVDASVRFRRSPKLREAAWWQAEIIACPVEELRKADAWLVTKGLHRREPHEFVHNWFARAQDEAVSEPHARRGRRESGRRDRASAGRARPGPRQPAGGRTERAGSLAMTSDEAVRRSECQDEDMLLHDVAQRRRTMQ